MSPKPKLGLLVSTRYPGPMPRTEELITFFRRAEELGFHSLWVIDRPLHKINLPHPLTILTYAAAVTSKIRLGTAAILLSLRQPVEMARQVATLDALAGGRVTLGVTLGGRPDEYEAMGVPMSQRLGRMVEGITVLKRLWTEEDVTFHGRYFSLEKANIAPKPPQPGGVPIIIGTSSDVGRRRTGRIADGWVTGGHDTPEGFARSWGIIQEAAQEAGRDPSKLINVKTIYVNVDADKERARRELKEWLASYYGELPFQADADKYAAFGHPREITQAVLAFGEAGAQTVALGMPWPDVNKLEWIAAEVMPALA